MSKILIVEDEKNIVDILSFNLSREGYETLEAYDGAAGLKLALEEDPDLILLDIMLPRMNGFETFSRIKDLGDEIPVIFLTASGMEDDVVSAIRLGAVNYLKKPYLPQELQKRVSQEFERQ